MDPEEVVTGQEEVVVPEAVTPPVDSGHPAWKEILDVLPDEFHELVKPTLSKWDKGVQDRFSEFHNDFDPYKPFVEEKVDPNLIQQSLYILQEIENNPQAVVDHIVKSFDLKYGPMSEQVAETPAPVGNPDVIDNDWEELPDIIEHPMFKKMSEQLAKMQERFETEDNSRQQQEQAENFEKVITGLETKHGSFDRIYVTALMANGIDGDEAVKRYHDTINQAAAQLAQSGTQQHNPPPVVMGGDGTTGSGLPDQSINVSSMAKNDINTLVADMLKQAAEQV